MEFAVLEVNMYDACTFFFCRYLVLLVCFEWGDFYFITVAMCPYFIIVAMCPYFIIVGMLLSVDIYGLWSLALVMTFKEMIGEMAN